MMSVTAAPMSVSSFMTRAKGSTMKLPPNSVAVPLAAQHEEAGEREDEHREPEDQFGRSLRVATPTISSTMAPTARISSGSATKLQG